MSDDVQQPLEEPFRESSVSSSSSDDLNNSLSERRKSFELQLGPVRTLRTRKIYPSQGSFAGRRNYLRQPTKRRKQVTQKIIDNNSQNEKCLMTDFNKDINNKQNKDKTEQLSIFVNPQKPNSTHTVQKISNSIQNKEFVTNPLISLKNISQTLNKKTEPNKLYNLDSVSKDITENIESVTNLMVDFSDLSISKKMVDIVKISQFVNNTVPIFTGDFGPNLITELETFIGCCENALSCLSAEEKITFLKIVVTRFRGRAYNVLQGASFESFDEVKSILRQSFIPEKPFLARTNELKQARQFPGEPLSSFAARVKQLLRDCTTAAKERHPKDASAVTSDLEEAAIFSFKTGVFDPQLRLSLFQIDDTNLDKVTKKAEKIEELKRYSYDPNFDPSHYHVTNHNQLGSPVCPSTSVNSTPQPTMTFNNLTTMDKKTSNKVQSTNAAFKCGFCSRMGHTYADCRTRKNTPFCTQCKVYGHNLQSCNTPQGRQVHALTQSRTKSPKNSFEIKCAFCQRWRHDVNSCRAKQNWEAHNFVSKQEN